MKNKKCDDSKNFGLFNECIECKKRQDCMDNYYSQFNPDKMIKASLRNKNYMNKTCKSLANCIYNLLYNDIITIKSRKNRDPFFLDDDKKEKKRFYKLFNQYLAACKANEKIHNDRMSMNTSAKSRAITEFDSYLK